MEQYIVDLQTRIKPKLRQIAHPSKQRHKHEQEQPGFRELLNQWKSIYQDVSLTMLSLSRRIETAEALPTQPTVRPAAPKPAPRKTDEITISLKEFDHLVQHMKNSWEKRIIDGEYVYVNAHDPSIKQWAMPANAYIKSHPRPAPRLARSPSYERRSPR
jgi:hypothetical protein